MQHSATLYNLKLVWYYIFMFRWDCHWAGLWHSGCQSCVLCGHATPGSSLCELIVCIIYCDVSVEWDCELQNLTLHLLLESDMVSGCYSSNYPILSLSSCSCWTSLEACTWLHIQVSKNLQYTVYTCLIAAYTLRSLIFVDTNFSTIQSLENKLLSFEPTNNAVGSM